MLPTAPSCVLIRFPAMGLAVPEGELVWRAETLSRGLNALPVRW
jgi:hypothetical protein